MKEGATHYITKLTEGKSCVASCEAGQTQSG
jgi:hypothetical protein